MAWTNAPQRVYHGTDQHFARDIKQYHVKLSESRPAADFGPGFYVTSSQHQAQEWANQKSIRSGNFAAVVIFDLYRDIAASLQDHLTFVNSNSDFFDFVDFNRGLNPTHGRDGQQCYDIVYGPVAAYPQRIVYHDCDQICFVTNKAIAALSPVIDVYVASPGPRFA